MISPAKFLWECIEIHDRERPIKRADLLKQFNDGKFWGKITDRELRKMKEDLIVKENKLIGSCEQGYFVIKTQSDFEESLAYYRNKALPLLKIRSKLKRSYCATIQQYQLL